MSMTNLEVLLYAKDYPDLIMEKARNKGYICPQCHNGTGKDGTGITLNPHSETPGQYKCFVCGWRGDCADYVKEVYGLQSNAEVAQKLRELLLLEDYNPAEHKPIERPLPKKKEKTPEEIATEAERREKQDRSNNYIIAEAHKKLNKHNYHNLRGLSDETAKRFYLGYYQFDLETALIIPTGENKKNYVARYLSPSTSGIRVRKPKDTPTELFNAKVINEVSDQPIFITEGEIDAISIEEVGGKAVGLGGTGNISKLIDYLQENKPTTLLIIAMDNDKAGKEASRKIEDELSKLEVPYVVYNPSGKLKDPNDALVKNKVMFIESINIFKGITTKQQALHAINRYEHRKTSAYYDVANFLNGIKESVNTPVISTGFSNLDVELDGGLYEGLYVLGAVSSLGKTTLALQMADQIAAQGTDVLIFSLEMSKTELMAKSISRNTCKLCIEEKHDLSNAKTVRGITDGKRYEKYNETEKNVIRQAVVNYREYSQNIFIIEGQGDVSVTKIRADVAHHIDMEQGRKPVIIVDYLQILAPTSQYTGDKQNVDKSVLELKRISRDFKLPVIVISSFNRESYDKPVSMSAFKESGGIEYGCDVLFGLQLTGVGEKDFDADKAYQRKDRRIDVKILKNRNGAKGSTMQFKYFPMFNLFQEISPFENFSKGQ